MSSEKRQRIYKIIMLIVLVAIVSSLLTTIAIYKNSDATTLGKKYVFVTSKNSDLSTRLESFKKLIDNKFLGEVEEEKLTEGAIKGYIAGLQDPYTEYMNKEEMEEFTQDAMGNFVGIGIYMTKDTDKDAIVVISPIKDSPAYKAGILPGDIISKVNDVEYKADDLSVVANRIKGESGSKVKLEIIRDGKTLNFEIQREKIKINHVENKVLDGNIGYLKLNTFDEGCSDEFKQKYEELKKQNVKALIVDLRNNGGGIVDEAISIAETMSDKDETLLITVDKNNNKEYTKSKNEKIVNVPIIVLVNGNSASASEILAGALKDNGKAKLVGTKTYGKGVIQELITLTDGSGLKITTEEYYTPKENKINKIGIEPDEEVKLPTELENTLEIEESKDTQLQKAIELLK